MDRFGVIFLVLWLPVAAGAGAAAPESRDEEDARMLACRTILARCWQALQPVREVLSLPPERLVDYGQRERFVARCRALTGETIDCLAASNDIMAAFVSCFPGPGGGPGRALQPPALGPLLRPRRAPGFSSRRSRRLLARLAGSW